MAHAVLGVTPSGGGAVPGGPRGPPDLVEAAQREPFEGVGLPRVPFLITRHGRHPSRPSGRFVPGPGRIP
ncbi:hypothetical protein GCM10017667_14010 [Streptomyces filamentosus]|uniref:Uncharacterized protein n=1 Tax=Streptomyces filamentosus TaxID=67294 RepID=A0A919BES6_STRFL|nr:hypothetical protein GCM10017667_14010 [Streptomyces filamentosus]